ncbi:hypothetical protein BU25DRAFT_416957 [Macroventuria anomochaeta]|uniref:Uncharacterized protein n=1 Tax=Macroventuria anomochaeta TaxID=301207 RepID=A0ACB6SJI1_9PLEO|nr:uncharacterized protein BU25DRAFT_416957 [Macroventuria anomochaeta]KAF2633807.1 hypothetical protein BU25DRAFT_416957 [Macroventuria anomochaeta]
MGIECLQWFKKTSHAWVELSELRKAEKLLKDKRDEQACVQRAKEKVERENARIQERKEIDARKAERAHLKEQKDYEKASCTTQKGKRQLIQQQGAQKKQKCGDAAARSGVVPHKPPSAPLPTHNSRGRKTLQPCKYWYQTWSHRSIDYSTQESSCNSFCMWLNNLMCTGGQ